MPEMNIQQRPKQTRVSLVCVLAGKLYGSEEHVGLGYLAGILRHHGFETDIHYVRDDEPMEECARRILAPAPAVLGFSTYALTVRHVLELCLVCKRLQPGVHISLGGPTATFESEGILERCPQVDSCVRGEGEFTFLELVSAIESSTSLSAVQGVTHRPRDVQGKARVEVNPDRPPIERLDDLPWAVRSVCEGGHQEYLVIETSRGCLGRCAFCTASNKQFYNKRTWRGRSVPKVVDEIELLVRRYKVRAFNIIDASFEDPGRVGRERNIEFAKEIIRRRLDITFMVHFRSESITKEDLDRIDLLMQAGLSRVSLGLESGCDDTLKNVYRKLATVADNERIVALLRSRHLALVTGFIMFQPYSTLDELRQNAQFLQRASLACRFENFEQFIEVYPGTELKARMVKDGLLARDFDFSFPETQWRFVDDRLAPFRECWGSIRKRTGLDFEQFDMETEMFACLLRRRGPNRIQLEAIQEFDDSFHRTRNALGDSITSFFLAGLDGLEAGVWRPADFDEHLEEKLVKPTVEAKRAIQREKVSLMRRFKGASSSAVATETIA